MSAFYVRSGQDGRNGDRRHQRGREALMDRFSVHIREKCRRCGLDNWVVLKGHNQCSCGQKLWIVRYSNSPGIRFRYEQGPKLPSGYHGWSDTTA